MKKYVVTVDFYPIPRVRKLENKDGLKTFVSIDNSIIMTEEELKDCGLTQSKIKEINQIVRNSKRLSRFVRNMIVYEKEYGNSINIKQILKLPYSFSHNIKKIIKLNENEFRNMYNDEHLEKIKNMFNEQLNISRSKFLEYIIVMVKRNHKLLYELINNLDNYDRKLIDKHPEILVTPDILLVDINENELDFINIESIPIIINFVEKENLGIHFNAYNNVKLNMLNNLVIFYMFQNKRNLSKIPNEKQLVSYGQTRQSYFIEKYNSKMRTVLKNIVKSQFFRKSFKIELLELVQFMSNIEPKTLDYCHKLKSEV